jgi:Tol biopolymer transport system component
MRAFGGVMLALAVAASAMWCLWPAAARAVAAGPPSGQTRGVIAFNCFLCGSFLQTATVVWSGGRVRIRGDVGAGVRWSPDGRWFAYSQGGIALQSTVDASVGRQLTPAPKSISDPGDYEPAWFPSGERLVFVRRGALWTIGSDGRGAKRLYSASASAKVTLGDPDVSHDGRRIAFDDSNGHLWVTGQRGLTAWRLGPASLNGSTPRWSPDDTRIAFLDGGGMLAVLDLRTNTIHDLGAGDPGGVEGGSVGDGLFSWSPDGRYLAGSTEADYDCGDPTGQPCKSMELWIVNATTGAAHLVYQTPDDGSIGGVDWH